MRTVGEKIAAFRGTVIFSPGNQCSWYISSTEGGLPLVLWEKYASASNQASRHLPPHGWMVSPPPHVFSDPFSPIHFTGQGGKKEREKPWSKSNAIRRSKMQTRAVSGTRYRCAKSQSCTAPFCIGSFWRVVLWLYCSVCPSGFKSKTSFTGPWKWKVSPHILLRDFLK